MRKSRRVEMAEQDKKWMAYWKQHDAAFEERQENYRADPEQYQRDWDSWLGDLHGKYVEERKAKRRRGFVVGGAVVALMASFGLGITAGSDNVDELQAAQDQLSQEQEKSEELAQQVEDLEGDLADKDAAIEDLKGQLGDAETQVEELTAQEEAAESQAPDQGTVDDADLEKMSLELVWDEMSAQDQDDMCFAWNNMEDFVIEEFASNGLSEDSVRNFFEANC